MTTPPTTSKYKSCKKTRQQDIPSILEQQHSECVNHMTKMHDDKMQRFDKFLDLMSNKLSEKKFTLKNLMMFDTNPIFCDLFSN